MNLNNRYLNIGGQFCLSDPAVVVWRQSSGLITELSLSRWINPRLGCAGLYGTNGPAMLCTSWMSVICVCKLKDYIIHNCYRLGNLMSWNPMSWLGLQCSGIQSPGIQCPSTTEGYHKFFFVYLVFWLYAMYLDHLYCTI